MLANKLAYACNCCISCRTCVWSSISPLLEFACSHLNTSTSFTTLSISVLCFSSLNLAASNAPLNDASCVCVDNSTPPPFALGFATLPLLPLTPLLLLILPGWDDGDDEVGGGVWLALLRLLREGVGGRARRGLLICGVLLLKLLLLLISASEDLVRLDPAEPLVVVVGFKVGNVNASSSSLSPTLASSSITTSLSPPPACDEDDNGDAAENDTDPPNPEKLAFVGEYTDNG